MVEKLSHSIRESVTLKLFLIFILTLLLMIPMSFIQSLIQDRDRLQQSTIVEVGDKWANEQQVYGPILTIPFIEKINVNTKEEIRKYAHILPSLLGINGEINPQSLHRGIYEVVVYDSKLNFQGRFVDLDNYIGDLKAVTVLWDEAFLTINISDLRGIKENITLDWNGSEKQVEPGSTIPGLINSGITVTHLFEEAPIQHSFDFSFDVQLQGSQHLGFVPLGKETTVHLTSDWKNPSFYGSFLPDNRVITEKGFEADYKILELNRNYPQFWTGDRNIEGIGNSAFGVDMLLPVNEYQKSIRSAKYGLLVISLTFLTFFLVEIFNKKKVHPFQYILIGLALCLFYTLLISISEHTNFNIAYMLSSLSVISMIGLYARSILPNIRQTIILVLVLCFSYIFVFVTLQLQDYALLIGSIGLTLILAFTMYITRKIDWYDLSSENKSESS